MPDRTGPDTYDAVLGAILVVAIAAASIINIRWRGHRHRMSLHPTHTRANTVAWLVLVLSVLLLIGAFVFSVGSSGQHGSFDRVRCSGLLVGLAYLAPLAAAISI